MAVARKKTHPDDSQIEAYCLGKITEPDLTELEEHLLICESCQQRVMEGDAYVRSMKSAGTRFRALEQKPRRTWVTLGLVPVLGIALAAVGIGTFLRINQHTGPRVPVVLEATRGAIFAQAPAGRPLLLNPRVDDLPVLATYRLEIVDRDGKRVLERDFAPGTGVETPSERSGTYFVRLYTPEGKLLREYALEIQ